MSAIVIRYDGSPITGDIVYARTNFRSVADGNVGSATIVIDDAAHEYGTLFHPGATLELLVDGVRQWDGWVFVVRKAWPFEADDTSTPSDVPRFIILDGLDRNLLFQKRILFDQADPASETGFRIWPQGTLDKEAIDYALEHYVDLSGDGLDYRIAEVATPGPYDEFTLGYVSAELGLLFEDAAKITGAVYYVSPQLRRLVYADDAVVNAPFILSDVKGAGRVNYREFEFASDYTKPANEALVWGAGVGSDEPVFAKYTDQPSVDFRGLWQWGEFYPGAWKQKTVNRRARTYVEGSVSHRRGHNDPVPVATCTIFEPGIEAGMVATIESQLWEISQDLPVRQVSMTFPTPTLCRFDLELTTRVDEPFGIPDLWPQIGSHGPGPIGPEPPWYPPPPTPTGGRYEYLIDHFDQTVEYASKLTTYYDWGEGGGGFSDTLAYTFVLPPSRKEGDFVLVALRAEQASLDLEPEGWTVYQQRNFYSEGRGWSELFLGRFLDGSEADTVTVSYIVKGDFVPWDAAITLHLMLFGNVQDVVASELYDATLSWGWTTSTRVIWIQPSILSLPESAELLLESVGPAGSVPMQSPGVPQLVTWAGWEAGQSVTTASGFALAMQKEETTNLTTELVTPGPEITHSPYPGGDPYHISARSAGATGLGEWRVEGSCIVVDTNNRSVVFDLYGTEWDLENRVPITPPAPDPPDPGSGSGAPEEDIIYDDYEVPPSITTIPALKDWVDFAVPQGTDRTHHSRILLGAGRIYTGIAGYNYIGRRFTTFDGEGTEATFGETGGAEFRVSSPWGGGLTSSAAYARSGNTSASATHVRFCRMGLIGSSTDYATVNAGKNGETQHGISAFGVDDLEVRHCNLDRNHGDGVYVSSSQPGNTAAHPSMRPWIHHNLIKNNGRMGVALIWCGDANVTYNEFRDIAMKPFDIEPNLDWEGVFGTTTYQFNLISGRWSWNDEFNDSVIGINGHGRIEGVVILSDNTIAATPVAPVGAPIIKASSEKAPMVKTAVMYIERNVDSAGGRPAPAITLKNWKSPVYVRQNSGLVSSGSPYVSDMGGNASIVLEGNS